MTDILEAATARRTIIHEQHVDKRAGGNIHGVYRAASGDIEQGFRESDEIIEERSGKFHRSSMVISSRMR